MSKDHQTGPAPIVLRIKPSAEYIGVSRAFLYQLISSGKLQKIKLGSKAAGVRRSDLDAWVESQAVQQQSAE